MSIEQKKKNLRNAAEELTLALIESGVGNINRQINDESQRGMIEVLIKSNRGNQSKCAEDAGLNRATMRTRMKRYGYL